MLKITEDANDKLIQSQLAFEKNLITFMPHNLRGLEEMIVYKDAVHQNEFTISVGELLRNMLDDDGNNMFDAVVPHGTKQNTAILACTTRKKAQMYKIRYHLLTVAKETFQDLNLHDFYNEMDSPQEGTTTYHHSRNLYEHDGEAKLDDIFAELDSTFPSLSISYDGQGM